MKVRKVLGGLIWVVLAAVLIVINTVAAGSEGLFPQTEVAGVSTMIQ